MTELGPPPRPIPPALAVRLLHGSFLSQWGWTFLAISVLMLLACVRGPDWDELHMPPERLQSVKGTVLEVKPYASNHTHGFSYSFSFAPVDGSPTKRDSLVLSGEQVYQPGARLPVEYLRDKPEKAWVEGHRPAAWSLWAMAALSVLIGCVFLALAIAAVFSIRLGWLEGRQALRLLRQGELSRAVILHLDLPQKQAEGIVEYELEAAEGRHRERASVKVLRDLRPDSTAWALHDAQGVRLLTLMLPGLPEGRLSASPLWFCYLLTPVLALAACLFGLCFEG